MREYAYEVEREDETFRRYEDENETALITDLPQRPTCTYVHCNVDKKRKNTHMEESTACDIK